MCRRLAHAYVGVTADNLRRLTEQLEERLRELVETPREGS
ncbi:hypothetical protein ACVWYI_007894 [Bradyrhizobium sp. LB13.1]